MYTFYLVMAAIMLAVAGIFWSIYGLVHIIVTAISIWLNSQGGSSLPFLLVIEPGPGRRAGGGCTPNFCVLVGLHNFGRKSLCNITT